MHLTPLLNASHTIVLSLECTSHDCPLFLPQLYVLSVLSAVYCQQLDVFSALYCQEIERQEIERQKQDPCTTVQELEAYLQGDLASTLPRAKPHAISQTKYIVSGGGENGHVQKWTKSLVDAAIRVHILLPSACIYSSRNSVLRMGSLSL